MSAKRTSATDNSRLNGEKSRPLRKRFVEGLLFIGSLTEEKQLPQVFH